MTSTGQIKLLELPFIWIAMDNPFFFFFNTKRVNRWVGGGLVAKLCVILVTLWTVAHQALLSMGFPRQEYWSGLPFPPPGDLPNPGIKVLSMATFSQKWQS